MGQTSIDSLKTALHTFPKQQPSYADALNQIGFEYWIVDSNESLKYGAQALKLSQDISYTEGAATANRIIGVAHWAQGNLVEAIKKLYEAERLYTEIKNEEGIANTVLNSGMVYADLKEYDTAIELYEKAINKFTILNKDDRIATAYSKIASLYIDQDRLLDAKTYLDNALTIHTKNNFTYGLSEVHNRLGILFLKQNNLEQAYYHIQQSITLGKNINDKDGMVSNLVQYGKLLRVDGKLDAANDNLRLGLRRAQLNSLKKYELEAYKELMELKKVEGKFDSSLYYYDSYVALKDSIFTSEKSAQIAAMAFTNQLAAKDKEVALLQEQEKSDRITKWALFAGVLLLTIAGLSFISSIKQRAKRSKEMAVKRQELLSSKEELARTALENAELKQLELEQKLNYKNKELTSYALNFAQKNEFLQQLQEKVNSAKAATPKEKETIIEQLRRDIKQYVTIDKDWEDFKRYFEDVHIDFFKKLKEKHPDLSSNDLKICSLTRLNLNIKETASILGISPESAKTARYRLRKKLSLAPEQDLLDYFLAIERS